MKRFLLVLMILIAFFLPSCDLGLTGSDDKDDDILAGTEGLPPEMPEAEGPVSAPSSEESALLDAIIENSLQAAINDTCYPALMDAMAEASKINPPLPGEACKVDDFKYGPAVISGSFIIEDDGDIPYMNIDFKIEDGYLIKGSLAYSNLGTVYDIYISDYEPGNPDGVDLIDSGRIYMNTDSDSFIASFSASITDDGKAHSLEYYQVDERDVEGNIAEKVVCILDDHNLSYILFAFTGSSMVPSPAPSAKELINMISNSIGEGYFYLTDMCTGVVSYTLKENGYTGLGDLGSSSSTEESDTSISQKSFDIEYLDQLGNEITGTVTINGIDEDGKVSSYDCDISSFSVIKKDEENDYTFSGRCEIQLERSANYYWPSNSLIEESKFENRNDEFGSFSDCLIYINQDEPQTKFSCLTYNGKKLEVKYIDNGTGELTKDNISITLDGIPLDPSILS